MASTPQSMLSVVTTGLQDYERLNTPQGQPSFKHYSYVFRRRTRWASQWRRVEFDNLADFGRQATLTIPIMGELITRATLVIDMPDIRTAQNTAAAAAPSGAVTPAWYWTNALGHAICSSIEMSISDEVIDTLDSRLLEVIDETERPIDHFDSTNILIQRDPSFYPADASRKIATSVEIVPPFWWNHGIGPQALPIQALAKDRVKITCQFRTLQELVYTPAREPSDGITMLSMAGAPFYDASSGAAVVGQAMPTNWHFKDAYWIIEYVSLEEREAAAFRLADLTYPIEQHLALPVIPTEGSRNVRIRLERSGLIRDMRWAAQRVEAENYNAYFLFSRELSATDGAPVQDIWWPNAQLPLWNFGDGYARPAFCDRRSDPIQATALWYRGKERFNIEGPSMFRSLIPALGCRRVPIVDRYIYQWNFGLWPSGGLAETLRLARDEIRGAANWDKIPGRELQITMNQPDYPAETWEPVFVNELAHWTSPSWTNITDIVAGFEGFELTLLGTGGAPATGGGGASVIGIVDYRQIQYLPGYQGLWVRAVSNGSAALVAEQRIGGVTKFLWIAVAGAGGKGSPRGRGGHAGSAAAIGFRGVDQAQTHAALDLSGGGGGGGRIDPGPGLGSSTGRQMPTTDLSFNADLISTGGGGKGGDGYYGGGDGAVAGGGGGSYVSPYITAVTTTAGSSNTTSQANRVEIRPLRRVLNQPKFNIFIWLTRYNMLRIYGGRAALMFAD